MSRRILTKRRTRAVSPCGGYFVRHRTEWRLFGVLVFYRRRRRG